MSDGSGSSWLKDSLEWLKTSPRYFVPILLACTFLLFSPTEWLDLIGLKTFRENSNPYLGLVFVASLALVVTGALWSVAAILEVRYRNYKRLSSAKARLKFLTLEEKKVLRLYLEKETRTQTFDIENGVVSGLVSAKILYPAVHHGDMFAFPINMEFLIWKYLREHPELVAV